MVAQARSVRDLPRTREAFARGVLEGRHVRAITDHHTRISDFDHLEATVVGVGAATDASELRCMLRVLAEQSRSLDLDGEHDDLRRRRGLSVSTTASGMVRFDGWLDPVEGARLHGLLARCTDPPSVQDPRSATQRRADGFAAILAAAAAHRGQSAATALTVTVDLADLPANQAARVVADPDRRLGPNTFELLTCSAEVSVVFGTTTGDRFRPLALGRTRRQATAAQWQALIVRDQGCVSCGRAAHFCHAHHIHHWQDGGPTDLDNLMLLCPRCHRHLHLGHLQVRWTDGLPAIEPADHTHPPDPPNTS